MVNVLSGNGTTTREVVVNNAERVGMGHALSKAVGVAILTGKVTGTAELTVRDVTAEVRRAAGKLDEKRSLERTGGLAVL